MYKCLDCEREFDFVSIKRISNSGNEKRIFCCPFCESKNYKETENTHYCKCCGAKLRKNVHLFCTVHCKKDYEAYKKQRDDYAKHKTESKIYKSMRELDEYNKLHGTNYSYGAFIALKDVSGL